MTSDPGQGELTVLGTDALVRLTSAHVVVERRTEPGTRWLPLQEILAVHLLIEPTGGLLQLIPERDRRPAERLIGSRGPDTVLFRVQHAALFAAFASRVEKCSSAARGRVPDANPPPDVSPVELLQAYEGWLCLDRETLSCAGRSRWAVARASIVGASISPPSALRRGRLSVHLLDGPELVVSFARSEADDAELLATSLQRRQDLATG